jgi:hypothetical protein
VWGALAAYLQSSVYPPSSRPLGANQVDLLESNRRHERAQSATADPEVSYLFSADRYFVTGDEALASFLEVKREGRRVPVRILGARAYRLHPRTGEAGPERAPLEYVDREGLNVNQFAPATSALRQGGGHVELAIEFELASGERIEDRLRFRFTPPSAIPARFTGRFSDAIEEGSLVIRAGIVVERPGFFLIDCNLFDATGAPVAWTRFKAELDRAATEVRLLFFGKAIVEAGARSPFHIGQLRGVRHEPAGGAVEAMPSFDGPYETATYSPREFSPAEYRSPHKQAKIEHLRSQLGGPHLLNR